MKGKCDTCSAEFEPNICKRREGGIETTFFCCPGCGAEHIVCRTNPELRKMQRKIVQERARIIKQRVGGRLKPERLVAFQQMVAEHKAKLEEFNGKTVV